MVAKVVEEGAASGLSVRSAGQFSAFVIGEGGQLISLTQASLDISFPGMMTHMSHEKIFSIQIVQWTNYAEVVGVLVGATSVLNTVYAFEFVFYSAATASLHLEKFITLYTAVITLYKRRLYLIPLANSIFDIEMLSKLG